jgi:hypothetical protein
MPLVGDVPLASVQRIEHELDGGFEPVGVPGLDGDVLQRAGRGSHVIRIHGVLSGESARDELSTLQGLAGAGEEVAFSADITTALELERVVVAYLRAHEVAGTQNLVGYEMHLVESPPLPPPAEVSTFGGLGDFGLGDLGFDTDVLGDIAGLAGEVAGAVDAVMEVADQLSALAALGSIDVGGPLAPMSDAVGALTSGAGTFASVTTSLTTLLGSP